MPNFPPHGLYAITAAGTQATLGAAVAAAIDGGATVVQYRDKSDDPHKRRREAAELTALCAARGVPLLVNDDVALAAQVGAPGVHIGRDDGSLAEARARLGADAIIGVSCYASLASAEQAAEDGATYVAFGSFFPSLTKPAAPPVSMDVLARARQRLRVPIVAIGGINASNGLGLVEAGATHLAVISAVFGAGFDATLVEQSAREFQACFARARR
ncbi:MAG: thiamine phosphate synthase [Gammaproteobacteria bacterium]|nr:thiamine phosphate synthase [Gammaproteobacteria bacterium]